MPRPKRAFVRFIARTLKGARPAPFPGFIEPCHPTLRAKAPSGERWQYEVKLDGYRAQLHWTGSAKVFTRNGHDWSDKFSLICQAAAEIPAHNAILDGEIVVQGENGVPDFHAMRSAMSRGQGRLLFYAFDLLHLDGFDLRPAPLEGRRRVLAGLLEGKPGGRILMSETIDEPGEVLYRHACEMGLEGIVAKRADAPYRSGRVETWIKVKCIKALRLPIIGYVPAKGNSIAALRLGRRDGKQLVYAGKVGTGFTAKSAVSVRERLEPLIRARAPLAKPLIKKGTIWVEPKIEAEIAYLELTDDGMVRHASFKGLKP